MRKVHIEGACAPSSVRAHHKKRPSSALEEYRTDSAVRGSDRRLEAGGRRQEVPLLLCPSSFLLRVWVLVFSSRSDSSDRSLHGAVLSFEQTWFFALLVPFPNRIAQALRLGKRSKRVSKKTKLSKMFEISKSFLAEEVF